MHIFTDASVNPQKCVAIGCYLILNDNEMNDEMNDEIKAKLNYIRLEGNSSTQAELETTKHILSGLDVTMDVDGNVVGGVNDEEIYLYTDCNNIVGLVEKGEYSEEHQNANLYGIILNLIDKFKIKVVKVKGHSKKSDRTELYHKIFAIVDQAARKQLRHIVKADNIEDGVEDIVKEDNIEDDKDIE